MEYNCRGGPLHAQLLLRREGRGEKGVLLVDRVANQAWLYEWDADSRTFACRHADPMPIDEAGLVRAAEEDSYDVIAAPWVVNPDGD